MLVVECLGWEWFFAAPYGNTPCMASAKGGKKFPGGPLSTGFPAFPGCHGPTPDQANDTVLDLATIPVVLTTESRTSSTSVVIETERPAGYCERIHSPLCFALRAQTRARQASTAARGN